VRPLRRRQVAPRGQMFQLAQLLAPSDAIDLSVPAPVVDDVVRGLSVSPADGAGHGYAPWGLPALRAAVAELTATAPEEVLITSGAHEALALIAALLVGRRQPVAVDPLTYPGLLEVLARAGGEPVVVAGDRAGMRADALRDVLRRGGIGFVYLMPGVANPTGASVAVGRRPALLQAAAEFDTFVVEDAALEHLRFDGPLTPLRALAPERVLHVGSMSKLGWAGLRVGWICGPRDLVGRLARLKGARDIGAGALGQLAALQLLRDLPSLRAARVAQGQERLGVLRAELAAALPSWTLNAPEGGWALWADMGTVDSDVFTAAAAAHGVQVGPGSAHVPGEGSSTALRLAFSPPPDVLREGVRRLAAAWATV
jgi:DNA-binding transcriptional MocR family regulator